MGLLRSFFRALLQILVAVGIAIVVGRVEHFIWSWRLAPILRGEISSIWIVGFIPVPGIIVWPIVMLLVFMVGCAGISEAVVRVEKAL